jgi:nuclear cap-binding protein subunit 1
MVEEIAGNSNLNPQMVEKMEEKLEAAFGDQKRIFLIIFQRFIMILSEHLVKCDTDGRDYNTDWYRWTIGRLQQVFLVVSFPLLSLKIYQ